MNTPDQMLSKRPLSDSTTPDGQADVKKSKASTQGNVDDDFDSDDSFTMHSSALSSASAPVHAPASSQAMPQLTLSEDNMLFIASKMEDAFQSRLESIITSVCSRMVPEIVKGVNSKLEDRVAALEAENRMLKDRVTALEQNQDAADQYSRRNSLRVSGVKEVPGENTDNIILDMARALGADLTLSEIDRSHRVGPKTSTSGLTSSRPRDIIVKFDTYRSRQKLYSNRTKARKCGYPNHYINEDLTRRRSDLLYRCRSLKNKGLIRDVWTSDGRVLVKDNRDNVRVMNNVVDIQRYT